MLNTEGLAMDERGKGLLDSGRCTNGAPQASTVRDRACLRGAASGAVWPGAPVFCLRGAVAT